MFRAFIVAIFLVYSCSAPVIKHTGRGPASITAQKKSYSKGVVKRKVKQKSRKIVGKAKKIYILDKSVNVKVSAIEHDKVKWTLLPYFDHQKRIEKNDWLVTFKGEISIGELTNKVVAMTEKLVGADISSNLVHQKQNRETIWQRHDFGCRVELASLFTSIIIDNNDSSSMDFASCWSRKKAKRREVPLGHITLHNSKKVWAITYKSMSFQDAVVRRTTLDAIEYMMERGLFGDVRKSYYRQRTIASIKTKLQDYDWQRIPLVFKNKKLQTRIRRLQESEFNGSAQQFLIESGLYKAVVESIGIAVP